MSFDRFLSKMGKRIQKARWLAQLTQEDVASEMGTTVRYYQRLEAGGVNPTMRTLYTLSRVLKRNISELVDAQRSRKNQVALDEADAEAPKRGRKPATRRDPPK